MLANVKLSDSGNYTCIFTNWVSIVTSTDASVEVQQFPSLFLQPKNVDEYLGNWNGAVFEITPLAFHIQDLNGISSLKDHQNFPKYQERIKIS